MNYIYRYLKLLMALLVLPTLLFLYSCGGDDDPEPVPTFALNVNSGTGGGVYEAGTVVPIEANTAPAGQQFAAWTGDVATVADVNATSTTLTMPAGNVTITATYEAIPPPTFTLTVNNGSGSGDYEEGATVEIVANAAPEGQYFDQWTGDVANLDDAGSATATVTMPAAAISVSASYLDKPVVSVVEGTWRIDKFFEQFGDDGFVEVNSSANDEFRLTFAFTDKYATDTYSMILGSVLAVPNYNSESNSGTWTVDDVENPTTLTFDPDGDMSSTVTIESASAERVIISWTEESGIVGKPDRSYKIELVPAA